MPDFIIKTHQKDTIYKTPHLFILNKGLNSGKPQHEPFTNSFVILLQNDSDLENLYFIAFSLWKSKFWHQYLIGSVIPFIRLSDFKTQFFSKVDSLLTDFENHQKDVAALKLLEQKEKQIRENINLINDLRNSILYRFCR